MSNPNNPAFVFIHGAWHDSHTWAKVTPKLEDRGYASVAIDLPGAGKNAKVPESFSTRPLDPAQYGMEVSPNAGVSQEARNEATLAAIETAATLGNGEVVLVGHSLGGITLSPVCQLAHDKIKAAVYLTAFLLPKGMPAVAMITDEIMAAALVPQLFMADPEAVGALRLDPNSQDETYLQTFYEAFYGDLNESDFELAKSHLHPDEPAQVVGIPSPITSAKFGLVPRHYIRCTQDRAIVIEGQDKMIAMVDDQMGNETTVHTLESSHSPFYSQPEQLVDILVGIAG